MYLNTQTMTQHSEQDIRAAYPNTSFPTPFKPPEVYVLVFPAPRPTHDPITQGVIEATPVLTDKGHYEQQWEVVALDPETVAANQAADAARIAAADAARIAALWQAAHDYEFAEISGSAIGLLAIGVMTAKPKCLAIQAWIKGIWTIYYTRKAGTSTDCNYTGAGEIPHTIPEMMEELGV